MKRLIVAALLALSCIARTATAQLAATDSASDSVWVQIEAHASLNTARERAQEFSSRLADVNGFSLGGSWYGILLGPYSREDARRVLQVYRAERQIPSDSFLAFTRNLGRQFWPEGADILSRGTIATPQITAPERQDTGATETATTTADATTPPDETRAEARRSERLLSAQDRRDLQIALAAAGFYFSTIDGAFGPGTRQSMSDWQAVNGFEPTGILTTLQRRTLMEQYNAPLISVGMQTIQDIKAGVSLQIPAGVVAFDRYEPPFAHYNPTGAAAENPAPRVLLISQPGDRATLAGLFDIMQTLEIVPLDGPRERKKDSFVIEGRGNGLATHVEASLKDGQIKGFALVWPAGDDDRRQRVLAEMKKSFSTFEGVLDPAEGTDGEQRIDLVAGLDVRKPRLSRTGFFSDTRGTVVTTTEAVQGCTRITLDQGVQATVAAIDDASGVAILKPESPLAPMKVARLRSGAPRLQSEVAVAGYSYEGVLGGPTLTFGTLADVAGLNGEENLNRLALAALPGDAGGPVMDTEGSVLGMLLPARQGDRQLPEDVSFAADAGAIRQALEMAGLVAEASGEDGATRLTPTALNRQASGITVLVSCWD